MKRRARFLLALPPAMAALLGVFALVAWGIGNWSFVAFGSDMVPMAPITAALLAILGSGQVLIRVCPGARLAQWLETGGALIVLAVIILEAVRTLAGISLPWDTWFKATDSHLGAVPLGRMANLTLIAFLLAAAASLTKGFRNAVVAWTSMLASAGCLLIGVVVLARYATGVPQNYGSATVPMAMLTALAFTLLGTGLLLNGPAVEFWRLWVARNISVLEDEEDRAFSWRLLSITILATVLLAIAGVFFIRSEQATARESVWRELDSVVSLKAEQFAAWREERLAEGRFLERTPAVTGDLRAFLAEPRDPATQARVRGWLEPIKGGDRYASILVVDAQLDVQLSIPDRAQELDSVQRDHIRAAMEEGAVALSELNHDSNTEERLFSVFVPLFARWGDGVAPIPGAAPIGAVLLVLNPELKVFPGLQEWPVSNATAEIRLAQREGDEVVFLTKPRHAPARPAAMRRSVHEPLLPGAMVARGETGVREGRDYRDVPVLFTSRAIRDSTMFLIAKIDIAEVYMPLRAQAFRSALMIVLVLVALGLGTGSVWRRRQASFLNRSLATERERAALAERLALVMRHANDIIVLLDDTGSVVEANERALAAYGYSMEELRALPPGGLRPSSTTGDHNTQLGTLLSKAGGHFETVHRRKDGTEFPVDVSGRSVEIGGSRFSLGIFRDVSERKTHEHQLKRLNRLYAALSEVNEAIVFATDRNALLVKICSVLVEFGGFRMAWIGWIDPESREITPVAESGDLTGYIKSVRFTANDLPGAKGPVGTALRENRTDVCNDIPRDSRMAPWHDGAARAGFRSTIALPVRRGTDAVGVLAVYASEADFFAQEEIRLLEEAALNIAFGLEGLERNEQRLLSGEALRASEARFRALFEHSLDGFMFTSPDDHVLSANPAACRILGRSEDEIIRSGREELLMMDDPRLAPLLKERERTGRAQGELTMTRGDGTRFEAEVSSVVFDTREGKRTSMFIRDITEKKKLQEQFLRAQRLESIGMLATGIAHDLNNILAPILMGVPMLRDRVSDARDLQLLDTLEKSGERGAGLVKQILGFAHGIGGESQLVQVKHLVRDMAGIIKETFPKSIRLETDIPSDLWTVKANPTQIHQVLLNLCVNARDAMPDGGTLELRGENCVLDARAAEALQTVLLGGRAQPGPWIVMVVGDTGTGIEPEILARIWDPFFTTKTPEKGTGLGLATVRGIVEKHRGFISLQSEPGRGTTFRVYLPAAESGLEGAPNPKAPSTSEGRGELILIVDDEELIRRTAAAILNRAGYRIMMAADGVEATVLFSSHSDEIRLVLTDLDMPNLNGLSLLRGIRKVSPEMRIVMMSGLAGGSRGMREEAETLADAFIAKPFDVEALQKAVHTLLRGTPQDTV